MSPMATNRILFDEEINFSLFFTKKFSFKSVVYKNAKFMNKSWGPLFHYRYYSGGNCLLFIVSHVCLLILNCYLVVLTSYIFTS